MGGKGRILAFSKNGQKSESFVKIVTVMLAPLLFSNASLAAKSSDESFLAALAYFSHKKVRLGGHY